MARTSVDFGVDLGTTNSAVAVLKGTEAEVIKNNEGAEATPSAVWIDKRGRLFVGRAAKERVEADPANACAEFKLRMGTQGQAMTFEASGRTMEPEELSAEVLKSLKADVQQRTGEELVAAVITVPAAFQLNQCEATSRAAELAGFQFTPLLQEPTAAALAYGFQEDRDKVFWLVYDLGGGTFDAAVVNVRDGEFSVVNHDGDNYLGGKLIDWAIVDRLLIPAVTKDHHLADFDRSNARWTRAIAKLKHAAEHAKIQLSRDDSAEVFVEGLCEDDRGEGVDFEFELKRGDVAALAEPIVLRSINLCRKVLADKRLGVADVEKILLVGGPTLSPYVREQLADDADGLGIPLDFSQDPITVVARGAAIFAGTQQFEGAAPPAPTEGEYVIQFVEYRRVGPDVEPFVGGTIASTDDGDVEGFTIEFVNHAARPEWRSGRVTVATDGAFTTTLWAEKGKENVFTIELHDPTGSPRATLPDRLEYVVGTVDTAPPLTHSIGVGLANNEMEWLMEKGTALPARRRAILRTTIPVRRGQDAGVIRIPVMAGEHPRADRNRRIGTLEVSASQVARDVPSGSEVEVSIEIDRSRLVTASAYVPILDEEFENPIDLNTEAVPEHDDLERDAGTERTRLDELRARAGETDDAKAQDALERIDGERIVEDVTELVAAARVDPDAAATCGNRILDLRAALDEVEDAIEWPATVAEAEQLIPSARDVVEGRGDANDRRDLERYEAAAREAIEMRDADVLRRRVDELRGLAVRVLDKTGELQLSFFEQLKGMVEEMRDAAEAERLIAEGERAIVNGNIAGLRNVNHRLSALLPTPPPPPGGDFSTVGRG